MKENGFPFFKYDDFRKLLAELIVYRKAHKKVFSYRWFSQQAGYSSPNFLKLVIDGERNLTEDGISKVCHVFKFTVAEKKFFNNLVQYNQAKTSEKKREFAEKILSDKRVLEFKPIAIHQFSYYNKWYNIPIREFIVSRGRSVTEDEIFKHLCPAISMKEVEESISTLAELKLIVKEGTGYTGVGNVVTSGDGIVNAALTSLHKDMIHLAEGAIERFPASEREVSAITLSLSPRSAAQLKKKLQEFRKTLFEFEASGDESRVYQVNFQMFPLSKGKE